MSPSKPSRIYTVGWICALRIERNASKCFLDKIHDDVQPPQVDGDDVSYSFGEINGHNIVMAVLPMDEYGTATAGLVATNMLRSFPDIRIALLVGIGGGAPYRDRDIRLGDVVVSTRVVQHDYGKRIQGKGFQVTGQLDRPPQSLRSAIQTLQDRYDDSEDGNGIDAQISRVLDQYPRRAKVHSRPVTKDVLYATNVLHPDPHQSCDAVCAQGRLVDRPRRDETYDDICAIHYGLIASGNTVLKDAEMRDLQAQHEQVLCFEMEAAGLMNTNFKCLVIRGICDYCDTHKNKDWQGYAAMAAAAYASDLLRCLPPRAVENESTMDVGRMLEQS